MNIEVVFTGGTIGSRIGESGYITPHDDAPYQLIHLYQQQQHEEINFCTSEPYYILSENLSAGELNKLISCVKNILKKKNLDGIIITHGTDTLAYTAAILEYVFGSSCIPIVLVSSDYPLEDKRANGLINFTYGIKFIKEKRGRGVFVSYCNKGGMPTMHRGTLLQQHLVLSADVASIGNCWYGIFANDAYVSNPDYNIMDETGAMFGENDSVGLQENRNEILRIIPYVGMTYPCIKEDTKVILHESYHSGTIGISEKLKKFVRQAKDMGVPIYLTGLTRGETTYETVSHYQELGILPVMDCAPIAQYCKLWLAVSNHLNIREIMVKCMGEDTINSKY